MNKSFARYGFALQDGDTAASAPAVTFLASGDSAGIDVSTSTEAVALTNGKRDTTADRIISGSTASAAVTTIATADMLGLLLYAALGSIETTGNASPYTHSIKKGESIPALTFFQQIGASNAALQTLAGCKVDSVAISAQGTTPPSIEITLAGCKAEWLASTTWSGPAFDITDGYFRTTDAEVLFSLTDGNAVEPPSTVVLSNVSFNVSNAVQSASRLGKVEPDKQVEGAATVTCSLEGTSDDTSLYRAVKTGSTSGTEVAKTIVTGALQVTFQHTKEDWSFVVKLGAIPWTIEAMSASTSGGPFDLKLSTDGAISVDGTSIEFILENDVESYEE